MKQEKISAALKSFWFFSSASILVSLAIAISVYRLKFGGALSDNSSDWSDFGSYMGGIFGPLVSFVTLLAVLKTVYLQRELLDAQVVEFERMNQIQKLTFEASVNQMSDAASDARKLQISAAQDTAIKVIDQNISVYERNWDRHNEAAFRFKEGERDRLPAKDDADFFEGILLHRDYARAAVDRLVNLSIYMSVTDFQSVQDVRKSLENGLMEIAKDISALRRAAK